MSMQPHTKRIGLFGGSFNPPHEGHLKAAELARKQLGLDEVWLMVSPGNPLKDPRDNAPFKDRMAMCEILARRERSWLKVSDIERRMGTRYTHQTLDKLSRRHPEHQFVWIMGSDNLRDFHNWQRWKSIMMDWPVAVIMRQGDEKAALGSPAARYFSQFRKKDPRDLAGAPPCWHMFNNPDSGLSARQIRGKIAAGDAASLTTLFNALGTERRSARKELESLAGYIIDRGLYKTNNEPPPPRPRRPRF